MVLLKDVEGGRACSWCDRDVNTVEVELASSPSYSLPPPPNDQPGSVFALPPSPPTLSRPHH